MSARRLIRAMYIARDDDVGSREDVAGPLSGDTGAVSRAEIVGQWRARIAGAAQAWRVVGPAPELSRWAWAADAVLACALTVGTVSSALSQQATDTVFGASSNYGLRGPTAVPLPSLPPPPPQPGPVAPGPADFSHHAVSHGQVILALLTALPLIARRRYPLAAFLVVVGVSQLYHSTSGSDASFTFAAYVIGAYSAVMYSPYRLPAMLSVLIGTGLIVKTQLGGLSSVRPGFIVLLLLLPLGLAANTIHTWKQRVHTLEAEREAATRLAAEQERSRIAHELHDVVTHNVSVMVVQAGAARKVMTVAPEQAREALLAIESGGRAAMTELRQVMGLLTMPDFDVNTDLDVNTDSELDTGLAPQPGLSQVPVLVARIRDTGVAVELTVTGTPVTLPAGMELAAYRVVQEALTNTVKHAVGARVKIRIVYALDSVRVEVADTGGVPAASARSGDRHGLIGLRDRLAIYGGTLETGKNLIGGGYRVLAVLPLAHP